MGFPFPIDAEKITDEAMQRIVNSAVAELGKYPYWNSMDDDERDEAFWVEVEEAALREGAVYVE